MKEKFINSELSPKFVYVVAGLRGYRNKYDDKITTLFARMRAESRLTEGNWYLFGYRNQVTSRYYRRHLGGDECDVVFVPQKRKRSDGLTDQREWRRECERKQSIEVIFPENPTNATTEDEHRKTWYLSPLCRTEKIPEVPRFFWLYKRRGEKYRGLVIKNLRLFRYGERWLDGSQCKYFTTGTPFRRRYGRSLNIYTDLKAPGYTEKLIPVIAMATLFPPYSVDLVPPEMQRIPSTHESRHSERTC